MASSTQKKNETAKKSGSGSKSPAAKSGPSVKSGASRGKKPQRPQKRPVRREIGGAVLLLLMLCVLVSYFKVNAIVVDGFADLIKGLFGWGYWLAALAFLQAGLMLVFHRGRPVAFRVTCALLQPLLLGTLEQVARYTVEWSTFGGVVKEFWHLGLETARGGVISGLLALGAVKLFSKVVATIVFTVLLGAVLYVTMHSTFEKVLVKFQSRVRYEEEEEEEEQLPAIHVTQRDTPKRESGQRPKAVIDIPLDDEVAPVAAKPAAAPKKEGRFTSFFRHKSDQQKTPDQVLREQPVEKAEIVKAAAAPAQIPAEPVAPAAPAAPIRPASVAAPVPLQEEPKAPEAPAAEPAPAPMVEEPLSSRKEKANTAREVAAQTAAVTAEIEQKLAEEDELYQFPPITLLRSGRGENVTETGAELRNNSRRLAETLTSFGVDAIPGDVVHGPSVTRYEFTLEQGVKLSKVTNLADDIALALGASGVRIAPIPDKISVVGIEVPNKQVTPVVIREVLESRDFVEHKSKVAFALGRNIAGDNVIGNIENLPHVLIAGTTGSGKSVCTNSLIISLLYKSTPDEVRFIMVDPKMVELAPYNGIPHLLIPVVTDPKKAAGALQWAVFEMMKRYKTFSEHGVKKLEEFNNLARASEELETLPAVVVVIDELADLMLVAAKEVEESICRVAQMGRAAGVHLVIATQRPSADVITGLMKANIPSRIAFAVASSLESRIILDNTGAEKLVGKGDMLYAPLGGGKPQRVQGCFISPEEIERVVEFVKESGEVHYSDEVMAKIEESMQEREKGGKAAAAAVEPAGDEGDELLPAAVDVVLEIGQASVSMLQRRLKLGYSRAARLVDQMEERGIVGPFEGSKPRQLLITRAQWQEMQMGGAVEPAEPEELPFDLDDESADI